MFRDQCCGRQEDFNANFSNFDDVNMNVDINIDNEMGNMNTMNSGNMSCPVVEPMQERVVNRTIMHEVPHVCPIRTRVINNHVYRHTYRPSYSCCEENVITNEQCGSCCQFR